ncbi:MAG: DUF3696 domain-containing protein [Planctomycetia bacterium]|nr:DUF3696 domain-containing protein [Planctomycetia bacterium]
MKIFVENVRSFVKPQEVELRPLNLLVGENSSGKTTFLAVTSCVLQKRFPWRVKFHDPPYFLGEFDTIVSASGTHARSFSIGCSVDNFEVDRLDVVFKDDFLRPKPAEFHWYAHGRQYRVLLPADKKRGFVELNGRQGSRQQLCTLKRKDTGGFEGGDWLRDFSHGDKSEYLLKDVLRGEDFPARTQAISVGPIRSRPRRIYGDEESAEVAEHDDTPFVLAHFLLAKASPRDAEELGKWIRRFGKEAALFADVDVVGFRRARGGPFELQIAVPGGRRNVVDVGYGVSQVLGVIVKSVMGYEHHRVMLIQQPEVHLHPRAQSALGTFFSEVAAKGKRTFLVETHSDYLVDRVRQEIARGTIEAKDVQILYFDKPKAETTIHTITLDRYGNVENPPRSYRSFFLQEETNLLTRTGD